MLSHFSVYEISFKRTQLYCLNSDNVRKFRGDENACKICRGAVKSNCIFVCTTLHFHLRNDSWLFGQNKLARSPTAQPLSSLNCFYACCLPPVVTTKLPGLETWTWKSNLSGQEREFNGCHLRAFFLAKFKALSGAVCCVHCVFTITTAKRRKRRH